MNIKSDNKQIFSKNSSKFLWFGGFITPINYAHKAGDGLKTRHHNLTLIHPALQAHCGATQETYVMEVWSDE